MIMAMVDVDGVSLQTDSQAKSAGFVRGISSRLAAAPILHSLNEPDELSLNWYYYFFAFRCISPGAVIIIIVIKSDDACSLYVRFCSVLT